MKETRRKDIYFVYSKIYEYCKYRCGDKNHYYVVKCSVLVKFVTTYNSINRDTERREEMFQVYNNVFLFITSESL